MYISEPFQFESPSAHSARSGRAELAALIAIALTVLVVMVAATIGGSSRASVSKHGTRHSSAQVLRHAGPRLGR